MIRFWACLGLGKVERKLTDIQLQYLRQYYRMNRYPDETELQEIAKQWNMDGFDFYLNLSDWFFGRRIADQEVVDRRDKARKTAA